MATLNDLKDILGNSDVPLSATVLSVGELTMRVLTERGVLEVSNNGAILGQQVLVKKDGTVLKQLNKSTRVVRL